MEVHGEVGRNYALLASTNLAQWVALTNFACTAETMYLVDAAMGNFTQRFYRLASFSAAPGTELRVLPDGFGSGGMDLILNGAPGLTYRLEVSSDLKSWTPLTNLLSTGATTYFRDVSATNVAQRFYRVLAP